MTEPNAQLPLARKSDPISRFAAALALGLAVVLSAAWSWNGEEPSHLHTLAVAATVYGFAAGFVLFAAAQRLLADPGWWIIAFALKLALTLAITQHAWFEPLAPDLLRVPEAIPGLQDSNLYDYHALKSATEGFARNWETLNFTWLSFGITGYLALIYTVFGQSVAYVSMCNALCSFAGVVMLCATLRLMFNGERRWDWVALALFIPSVSYYDATPAKEPLTHLFYYSALYGVTRAWWQDSSQRRWGRTGIALPLGLLAVVRANVTFLFIFSNSWPVLKRIGLVRSLLIGLAAVALTCVVMVGITGSSRSLVALFDMDAKLEQTLGFVQERADAGETGLKQWVAEQLTPRSVFHLALWSPVRPVIWFYLPYPMLIPHVEALGLGQPSLLFDARLEKVRAFHDFAFVLTGWLLVLATPFLLGAFLAAWQGRSPKLRVLVLNLVVSSFLIGNLMFVMGRRYRTLFEPLVLALVLVALRYGYGRRLVWPCWLAMGAGVAVVALL